MKPPVSVILIRENAEQLTGGDCGALDDDDPAVADRDLFRQTRKQQQDLGALHRAIRESFPKVGDRERVSVVTVDDELHEREVWESDVRAD